MVGFAPEIDSCRGFETIVLTTLLVMKYTQNVHISHVGRSMPNYFGATLAYAFSHRCFFPKMICETETQVAILAFFASIHLFQDKTIVEWWKWFANCVPIVVLHFGDFGK